MMIDPLQYSDEYFLAAQSALLKNGKNPVVTYQYFQRNEDALLCGVAKVLDVFKSRNVVVETFEDGTVVQPFEPVMHVTGPIDEIIATETAVLGFLSRGTKIATNVRKTTVLTQKKVLFFPARFDLYLTQEFDGYAAKIGGADGVSTEAQARTFGLPSSGTMPHAFIAAYGGDVAQAALAFAQAGVSPLLVLVDFNNDCVGDSLKTARLLREHGFALDGVRLDTSSTIVDVSLDSCTSNRPVNGVSPELVTLVRTALDSEGFEGVKIYASGGFTPEKIARFEKEGVAVDGYGVGSYYFSGNFDYTADVVKVEGELMAKAGRSFQALGPGHRIFDFSQESRKRS